MIATGVEKLLPKRPFRNRLLGVQLLQKSLGLLQVERIEALGEPAVDRREQFSSLLRLPLIAPEPHHARRRAQFPGLCFLLASSGGGALEIPFRFAASGSGDFNATSPAMR
jgi:hypothetical protein